MFQKLVSIKSTCNGLNFLLTSVPRVVMEEEVLEFGNLPCGQSVTKTLHIRNVSDVTALFQV